MKLRYLLTISLAVLLSACGNQNPPIQANDNSSDYIDEYQNTPSLTNTEALAVGATGATVGAVTGYALGKYANKPRYSKPKASYSKPVVVVNKHYYQTKPRVRVSSYKRK